MTIRIVRTAEAGNLERERLVLRAEKDYDIGKCAVFQAMALEGSAAGKDVPRAYWFDEKRVNRGDFVVLYTKDGKTSEKKLAGGRTSHFFYWGRPEPVWTQGFVPVVVYTDGWQIGDESASGSDDEI